MLIGIRTIFYNISERWSCLRKRIMFENRDEIQKKGIIHSRRFFYKKIIFRPLRIYRVLTGHEINLRHVEVVLTTFCTLNCKGCSALMPLYTRDYKRHIDFEVIAKSIRGLTRVVDYVDRLRLLGGEPLLYPHLYDVLCLIQSQKMINQVEIVTNGTLMIKDERVIKILKDGKCMITISEFVRGGDAKLIQQLKENGINYRMYSRGSWLDFGEVTEKGWNNAELRDNFLFCKEAHQQCNSVLNGILYLCPRESHGANLALIPIKKNEYIDLLDDKITKKQMSSFVYRSSLIEACKYCGVSRKMNNIPVAEQVL